MSSEKDWFFGVSHKTIAALAAIEPIGPIGWQKVRRGFGSLEEALSVGLIGLEKAGLTPLQARSILEHSSNKSWDETMLNREGIRLLTDENSDYPPLLKQINDPPLWLFTKGTPPDWSRPTLTVVGSRQPTAYAKEAIKQILPDQLAGQLTIVSGLAYGVDKLAHLRAIEANAPTIAVLAGGLDRIYPQSHTSLADEIISKGGALLSEYPPLDRPQPYKFPVRNRILAGLSRATIVVEAKIRSGSLTTSRSALDYNREVLAVPGEITKELSEGPNFLIKRGATLVDSPELIAELYGLKLSRKETVVDEGLQNLLHLLSSGEQSVEQLVENLCLPIEEVLGVLTQLELADLIYQSGPGQYIKKK